MLCCTGGEPSVLCLAARRIGLRICLQDGWMLLVADSLLFPCIYLSDAIGRGVMTRHLLPQGFFRLASSQGFYAKASKVPWKTGSICSVFLSA